MDSFSSLIYGRDKIYLELGPGEKKCMPDVIGIDVHKKPSVDYVADFNKGLMFIEDETVDQIYAYHVLEHVYNLEFFMSEIFRVLKKGGALVGSVPHFSNPYFYSDYTHRTFWGLYSLCYFSKTKYFYREVPVYYNSLSFNIDKIEIVFSSPFRYRNAIKKLFQLIFNINKVMQEFYEENLVYLIPCYEISFKITKENE